MSCGEETVFLVENAIYPEIGEPVARKLPQSQWPMRYMSLPQPYHDPSGATSDLHTLLPSPNHEVDAALVGLVVLRPIPPPLDGARACLGALLGDVGDGDGEVGYRAIVSI